MMKKTFLMLFLSLSALSSFAKTKADTFPDGTVIPAWFSDTTKVDVRCCRNH